MLKIILGDLEVKYMRVMKLYYDNRLLIICCILYSASCIILKENLVNGKVRNKLYLQGHTQIRIQSDDIRNLLVILFENNSW